ncbi:ATP-binding protein [Sulfitobacter sabulilitoris]|uniref:histidine kinase n=1 Tax=Sulfitobacter sabulilitoris TaxID=2562655 RepID=A0A5S3PMH7_9RHOB|nr:ATP-binding protein [Sulfitobacter sabulilitoris]TMM55593.1 response regulator [Sulfitobacter sabulilitoris]
MALWTGAATLIAISGLVAGLAARHARRRHAAIGVIADFLEKDATPSFATDADGLILSTNAAARAKFGNDIDDTLTATLTNSFANPGSILFRLQTRAQADGAAREDLVTRKGHVRLGVHQMGQDGYLWRVEDIIDHDGVRGGAGPALPMVMLGRTDAVLFMNDPARKLVGTRVKSLDRLFLDLPLVSGSICDLSGKDGPLRTRVVEVEAGAGRRAIYLLPADTAEEASANDPDWGVVQDLPVPLLKISASGTVQGFNRMAASLVGVALRDGVTMSELMEGPGRAIGDWLSDVMEGRTGQPSEFLRLKRADKEVIVRITLNQTTDRDGPALIAVLHDATKLKTLEAQFVQSQKMQAIGQLAGGVAHDFNNLLTAISGHCDLLLLRHDQGDPDYGDLVQINQNANRAAALVGQLLAFSRKQTLSLETVDMRDTLADLTHLLNRLVGEKITLTLSHDPVLKSIRADKRQLEQVMMNLVVNARDAMPAGGEIRIVTESITLSDPLERDRVTVPVGDYVAVRVIDNGSGIGPDKLPKVFEPFFTTKRTGEGTGLGLSTAYGIVKQTGGYIFVDSQLGEGTCFSLYFPVLSAAETARAVPHPKSTAPAAPHGDGVILLVEDEAPVRAFASRALRLRGYTVHEADSAEAALKTLEDETLNIDVFVTDVVMPGMDGPSWVKEALKERPGVRVVFVSGYAEESFGEAQTNIPNSVFLPKPFSLSDLTETVHNQLH